MARKQTTIPDFEAKWDNYTGDNVEEFVKAELQSRYGYINIPQAKQNDGFFHIQCFMSEADFAKWRDDPAKYANLLLQEVAIPISTDKGVTYSARLTCSRSAAIPIVASAKDFEVGFRFNGVMNDNGEISNAGYGGIVTIQRSVDGGNSWETVGTTQLTSRDSDDKSFDAINIGAYFTTTNPQQLRIRASYNVTDDDGNIVTSPQSAWITFSSIIYTEIGLQYSDGYEQPLIASSLSQFPLRYHLKGEVARTLHVRITGSKGTGEWQFAIGATQNTNFLSEWSSTAQDDADQYGLLSHGVKTIEAWLTCSDGVTADAIESEHEINQRMVVADESDATPRLLIQGLKSHVVNYVSDTLFSYSVYAPAAEEVAVTFRFSDYSGNNDYLRMERLVFPNSQNSLVATLEIEDASNDELYAYFHAEDSAGKDMVAVSTITVDNKDKFAPTLGAAFALNPKTRNNSEPNPFSIVNGMTGEVVEGSEFENFSALSDLWVQASDGQRVLRVLAGQKVTINYDWLKAFATNPAANVTMEFDVLIDNVTDEDLPIIDASEPYGANFLGLKMRPLEGDVFTKKNVSSESQNFGIQEGVRTHIAINIVSALRSTADSETTLALCRVFVNGVINREFMFDKTESVWYDKGSKIVIGQDHADIDVYGMRIYNSALATAQVMQDYIATLPSAEEKRAFRQENAILGGDSLVNADLCKAAGKNVLIWHGIHPSYYLTAKQKGWWEIHIYNEDGSEDLEHSGTICKETGELEMSAQGTTAKTYYYHNGQTKLKDVEAKITVAPNKIHPDYINDYLDGVAPTEPIEVVDGWVDGNGLYRGPRWMMTEAVNYSQKLVNKINYASSMQSHIKGGNNLYNDLHTRIVGRNSMQKANAKARVCKPMLEFMFFIQESDSAAAVFSGPSIFGPGKMDDGNVGYSKSKHPNFALIEGADNNLVLTDFRTPWESKNISWDIEKGEVVGFKYNGSTSLDLDKCKMNTIKQEDGSDLKVPADATVAKIKEFVNFVYMHDPSIKVYVGPWSGDGGFLKSDNVKQTNFKWWCTSGADAYKLRRWNEVDGAWIEAGWDAETETAQVYNLATLFPAAQNANAGQWDAMNKAFIRAIADDAKATADSIINTKSLRFHYCFCNTFLAGTDNCSKNTYYALDPVTLLWEFWQDDLDTIIATDNSGYQTKPYYISRLLPCKDGSATSLYEGGANALFNLEEAMYEDSGENRAMFREIFSTMSSLASATDNIPWIEASSRPTPWGCLWKYFFATQKYFPAVAYNEAARIRYEYPSSLGFVSSRNVNPITQSMGDQLQAELQYMKRRLVLYASYAEWGDFERDATGNVGVEGSADVFGIQAFTDVNGDSTEIKFKGIVPHQYIYPGGYVGTTNKPMRVRCKPGVAYDFDMTSGTPVQGDTACAFFGSNYFRSLGNIGDLSVNPNRELTINAKRLMDFTAVPSDKAKPNFRPATLTLNAPLIERLETNGSSGIKGTVNLSQCIRLKSVDTRGCASLEGVTLPASQMLTSLQMGDGLITFSAMAQPNLAVVTFEGYDKMRSFALSANDNIQATIRQLVNNLYEADPADLSAITLKGVDLTGITADVMMWLCAKGAKISGKITLAAASSDRYITFIEKMSLVDLYGDVDSDENDLRIVYDLRMINQMNIARVNELYNLGPAKFNLSVLPVTGNNLAVENGRPAVVWSIEETAAQYAHFTDTVNGILEVTKLAQAALKETFVVTVKAKLMDGTEMSQTTNVRFYRRLPEVGDFAYSDGTFDNQYDASRTLIGAVYKVDLNEDGSYTIRVMSKEDVPYKSSDASLNTTSIQWGLYQEAAETNGFNATLLGQVAEAANLSSAIDTAMPNNSTRGFYKTDGSATDYLTAESYRDPNTEDGYKVLTPASVFNDFNGKGDTATIIAHANAIILNYLGESLPTTVKELCDAMQALVKANGGKTTFSQFYYPAAYGCYLYEPQAEVLDEQYKKGEWYLPAAGELGRIYNFFLASAGNKTSTSPKVDFANEQPQSEAVTPLFSNIMKRLADSGTAINAFTMPALSYFWSSSEYFGSGAWYIYFGSGYTGGTGKYGSFFVRPVAAFTFNL